MITDLSTAVDAPSRTPSFRLKGGLFPMTLLEISNTDPHQLRQDLIEKVAQAPAFFQQAPAVITLTPSIEDAVELKSVIQLCLEFGLIVVALRGGNDKVKQQASELNLALMPATREKTDVSHVSSDTAADSETVNKSAVGETQQPQPMLKTQTAEEQLELSLPSNTNSEPDAESADTDAQTNTERNESSLEPVEQTTSIGACKIISTPVRSGQQIYAAGGDLIVLAPVSAGAELLADGNIHVYGPLRGRALAGVKGNTQARVFCQSQEAELISIAGCFMVDEDLRSDHWKQAVQVTLKQEKLTIQSLT